MLSFRELRADCATHKFVSGDSEIDGWLRKKALKDHSARKHIVTCAREDDKEDILGFYALSSVVESARALPDVDFFPFETDAFFPCLQLVYLAVHQDHQRKAYGSIILAEIVRNFANVGEYTGLPALIVTPLNEDAKRFYLRFGFTEYPRGPRLVLPIQAAIAAVEAANAELEAGGEYPLKRQAR